MPAKSVAVRPMPWMMDVLGVMSSWPPFVAWLRQTNSLCASASMPSETCGTYAPAFWMALSVMESMAG